MPREFDESGQFKKTTTHKDILNIFDNIEEVVTVTSEIADKAGCGRETARKRLTDLYEDGQIDRRKHGRMIVWWKVPPEEAEKRPERRLQRLSRELDEAIIVGDTVYEDGDRHPLEDDDEQ